MTAPLTIPEELHLFAWRALPLGETYLLVESDDSNAGRGFASALAFLFAPSTATPLRATRLRCGARDAPLSMEILASVDLVEGARIWAEGEMAAELLAWAELTLPVLEYV